MNIKRLLGGAGVVALWFAMPVLADLESATMAYEAKNYADALKEYEQLAKLGELTAQFNLGVMHYRGDGIPKDPVEAFGWISLVADLGLPQAVKIKDKLYNSMSEANKTKAECRATMLAGMYSPEALGKSLLPTLNDEAVSENARKRLPNNPSLRYPKEALQRGAEGTVQIKFRVTKSGRVFDSMVVNAIPNSDFNRTVLNHNRRSRYVPVADWDENRWLLAVYTFAIENSKLINRQKLLMLKNEAEAGSAASQAILAQLLYMPAVKKELPAENANKWMTKAAQSGVVQAQYLLGNNLMTGEACQVDHHKALTWLTAAAQYGQPSAQYDLAHALLDNPRVTPERAKAMRWLELAAQAKHPYAARDLAWIMATSVDETQRDGNKALQFAELAVQADDDNPKALETLAAAQAENADFSAAVKTQEKALEAAEELDWDLAPLTARLQHYQQKKPWREAMTAGRI